jgi:hypothetical protein
MTLVEAFGLLGAAVAAAGAGYRAVSSKIDAIVGKKEAPGDGSLRDLVMRVEGKIDGSIDATAERFDKLDKRLGRVESRVFSPPPIPARRPIVRVVENKPE